MCLRLRYCGTKRCVRCLAAKQSFNEALILKVVQLMAVSEFYIHVTFHRKRFLSRFTENIFLGNVFGVIAHLCPRKQVLYLGVCEFNYNKSLSD